MIEISAVEFHQRFYITSIQKLSLNFPHVHMVGTHNRGNKHRQALNFCTDYQYMLFFRDYPERLVASFTHQSQP